MRIAIIVPVYNERACLPAQLEHLKDLTRDERHVEVVLVDGGSSDGSRELLAGGGLPWITADRGRAVQMNAGAEATSAPVLLFLHADSSLPTGAVQAVREAARSSVGGFFSVRLESERFLMRLTGRLISLRSRLTRIATGDQALWFRREAFNELGGYPALPLFEDVEICRAFRRIGPLAPLDLEVRTSARRWESAGPWRTILRMWLLRAAHGLGISPLRLARFYRVAR